MQREEEGLTVRTVRTVEPTDCATQWGNTGLEVLSTPAILGNMERVCADAMSIYLEPGEMTVGVNVTMNHRAPIPVGRTAEYLVRTPVVDRRTEFSFEVRDGHGNIVCEGTHLRAVIALEGFQNRIESLK